MVVEPQELIPQSTETAITSNPSLARRIYGPAQPVGAGSPLGPETLYTVPDGFRATLRSIIAANVDTTSPPVEHTFSISIGDDAPDTRIFSDAKVTPGEPFISALDVTLEAGQYLQAPAVTDVTITINADVVAI
jgi:hypothetical protein